MGFPSITGAPGSNGGIYAVPAVGVSAIGIDESFPLDVVEYGGQLVRTVAPAFGSSGVILPAPPANFSWRLHRWGCIPGTTVAGMWGAALLEPAGEIDAQLLGSTAGVVAFGVPLYGVLASGAVSVNNALGTCTFFVRYDQVMTPVTT